MNQRLRTRAALAAVALLPLLAATAVTAGPKKRYYVEIEIAADKTSGGPKELGDSTAKAMAAELAKNPLYVVGAPGDGAPPPTDEPARRAWLKTKGLTGLSLQITLSKLSEKKEPDHVTLTYEISALLITRPGGWMIITTKGIGEAEGTSRKSLIESCVEGAVAGAAENLTAHLLKKPVEDKPK
jgi:hypothetical protein